MTVSALLPVHAGVAAEHLSEALESLLAQSVPVDEVVVVEDGPLAAEHHEVLDDLERRHPRVVRIALAVNGGAGLANQAGLEVATGEWIAKLDADDVCRADRVELQLAAVRQSGADVCGAAMLEFDDVSGDVVSVRTPPTTHDDIARRMRSNNPVNHPTAFYRRALALEAGGYPDWRYMQDYGLMARLLNAGAVFVNLEAPLVRFRAGGGVTRRRRSSAIRRLEPVLARELRDLGIVGPARRWLNLGWRTGFRLLPASMVGVVSRRVLARPASDSLGERDVRVRIGVTNAVLPNTGDAAIFLGVKLLLEQGLSVDGRGVDVVVFDSNAASSSTHYPDWTVVQQALQAPPDASRSRFLAAQLSRTILAAALCRAPRLLRHLAARPGRRAGLRRSLWELGRCDVVVSTGGTYLVDHYDFTHRLLELRCAKALGKPVVLWTQSLGPFRTRRSRRLARGIAECADAVFCRDRASADHWREATGWPGELMVVPDAAFALEAASGGSPGRAAISVRAWDRGVGGGPLDRSTYESMMRSSVTTLRQGGLEPVALSTCQGVPDYGYDDSVEAARVFSGLDVEIDGAFHTPGELLRELSTCQLVVTTRMHLAILALVSRVPVVAVAYEFKTEELFASLGLGHAVIRIEDSSPEWMRRTLVEVAARPERFTLPADQLAALRVSAAVPAATVRSLAGSATERPDGPS